MSNYEIYIVELLETDSVERDADIISQHIDKAFCDDKITYSQRNDYKAYLKQRIVQEREREKLFNEKRRLKILEQQAELRDKMEYKAFWASAPIGKRTKKLR